MFHWVYSRSHFNPYNQIKKIKKEPADPHLNCSVRLCLYVCTYPSLCLLGWQPRIRCGRCGWACWWSGYVDVTARSGGSCLRCCCTPGGWRRRPSQQWTSRSPSQHPPPLGTGAGKIDSWAPASLRIETERLRLNLRTGHDQFAYYEK